MSQLKNVLFFFIILTLSFDTFLTVEVMGVMTVRIAQLLAFTLVLILVFEKFLRGKLAMRIYSPVSLPLFLFCVWAFFSISKSAFLLKSTAYALWTMSNFVFFFLLPIEFLQDEPKKTVAAIKMYLFSFMFMGLLGIYQFISLRSDFPITIKAHSWIGSEIPRACVFSYEPSYYVTYMILGITLSSILFFSGVKKIGKLNTGITAMVGCLAVILSTATTGLVALLLLVGSCFYYVFRHNFLSLVLLGKIRKSCLRFGLVLLSICSFFFIIGFLYWDYISYFWLRFFYDPIGAGGGRWNRIIQTLQVFKENVLMGVGIGGFGAYVTSGSSGIDMWDRTACGVGPEILAEMGIIGFLIWLWIILVYIKSILRLISKEAVPIFWRRVLQGMLAAFILEVVLLQINQNFLRLYVWFHLGLSMAIYRTVKYKFIYPKIALRQNENPLLLSIHHDAGGVSKE